MVTTMVGIGLSRGGEGEALTASQSLLVAQLNAARAQAALGDFGQRGADGQRDAGTVCRAGDT